MRMFDILNAGKDATPEKKAVPDRQQALADLVHAVKEYKKLAEGTPRVFQMSAVRAFLPEFESGV